MPKMSEVLSLEEKGIKEVGNCTGDIKMSGCHDMSDDCTGALCIYVCCVAYRCV